MLRASRHEFQKPVWPGQPEQMVVASRFWSVYNQADLV